MSLAIGVVGIENATRARRRGGGKEATTVLGGGGGCCWSVLLLFLEPPTLILCVVWATSFSPSVGPTYRGPARFGFILFSSGFLVWQRVNEKLSVAGLGVGGGGGRSVLRFVPVLFFLVEKAGGSVC